jgi:hypothetical protein
MKYKDNNLFDFINFVFKNSKKEPKDYKPPVFLINRWISMANPLFAKIVNLTTNKWCTNNYDFDIKSFYRTILPEYKTKISYIKKKEKEKDISEDVYLANVMECSHRELLLFKDTLEELKCVAK